MCVCVRVYVDVCNNVCERCVRVSLFVCVCLCVCTVCIYVCWCVCMYVSVLVSCHCIYAYLCVHVYLCTSLYTCMYVCLCVYVPTCIFVWMCVIVCAYVFMFLCLHVCSACVPACLCVCICLCPCYEWLCVYVCWLIVCLSCCVCLYLCVCLCMFLPSIIDTTRTCVVEVIIWTCVLYCCIFACFSDCTITNAWWIFYVYFHRWKRIHAHEVNCKRHKCVGKSNPQTQSTECVQNKIKMARSEVTSTLLWMTVGRSKRRLTLLVHFPLLQSFGPAAQLRKVCLCILAMVTCVCIGCLLHPYAGFLLHLILVACIKYTILKMWMYKWHVQFTEEYWKTT